MSEKPPTTTVGTTGSYDTDFSSLIPKTHYYARPFATNGIGTTYGEEIEFDTKSEASGNFFNFFNYVKCSVCQNEIENEHPRMTRCEDRDRIVIILTHHNCEPPHEAPEQKFH